MPPSEASTPSVLPGDQTHHSGPSVFDLGKFSEFTALALTACLTSSPHQLGVCHKCAHNERGPCNLGFEEYVRGLFVASNTSVAVGIGSHVFLAFFYRRLWRSFTSICSVHFVFTFSLMISQRIMGYEVPSVRQWGVLTRDTFRASELHTSTLVVSKFFESTPQIPRVQWAEMSWFLHNCLSIAQPIEWMSLWTRFNPLEYPQKSILGRPLSGYIFPLPSVMSSEYLPSHVPTCRFFDFSRLGSEEPGDSPPTTLFGKGAMRDKGDGSFIDEVARSLYSCNTQLGSSFNLSNKLGKEVNSQPSRVADPPAFVASGSSSNHMVNPRLHPSSASDFPPQHALTPLCVPFSRSPSYPIGTPGPFTPGWRPNVHTAPTPVCQDPTLTQDSSFSRTVPDPGIAQHPTFRRHPSMRHI